jgi:hypothetical protein
MKRTLLILVGLALVSFNVMAAPFKNFDMVLNGAAALVDSGNTLRVSPVTGGTGTAYVSSAFPVTATASFSTWFKFRIGDGNGADGMTFIIQADGPDSVGQGGGGLGYGGISPSIAVEMDTYLNGWDPNANHLGINRAGATSSETTYTPGSDLDNETSQYIWIDYDGAVDQLSVYHSDANVKPGAPVMTLSVALDEEIGSSAYIGFTASTGGATNNHDIQDWTLSWDAEMVSVPTLGQGATWLLILLLVGLGLYTAPRMTR